MRLLKATAMIQRPTLWAIFTLLDFHRTILAWVTARAAGMEEAYLPQIAAADRALERMDQACDSGLLLTMRNISG